MQNENLQLVLSDDTILQISVIHSKDRAPISDTTSHVIHINQLLNQTVSGTPGPLRKDQQAFKTAGHHPESERLPLPETGN